MPEWPGVKPSNTRNTPALIPEAARLHFFEGFIAAFMTFRMHGRAAITSHGVVQFLPGGMGCTSRDQPLFDILSRGDAPDGDNLAVDDKRR